MQVKKKYSRLFNFLNAFDNFKDSDTLVEISADKYNKLKEFADSFSQIITTKIKVSSADNFDATQFGNSGDVFAFGWYENSAQSLGYPQNTNYWDSIIFNDFYWKNNYYHTKTSTDGIKYVSLDEQWTTRGIEFKHLIIDSEYVVYFGRHQQTNGLMGRWEQTILYVNDELLNDYITLYTQRSQMPAQIKSITDYNNDNLDKANWWLTY